MRRAGERLLPLTLYHLPMNLRHFPAWFLTVMLCHAAIAADAPSVASGGSSPDWVTSLKSQNLLWDSPSLASKDSMPIGNGDIGINVWNDAGELMIYLGKTDAFDESGRLLKLGRLRVHFSNNPFAAGQPFRQELDLLNGEITLRAGAGANAVTVRLWVDANHPVVHVETQAATPIDQSVKLEVWRSAKGPLQQQWEKSGVDGMSATEPPISYPDTIVDTARVPGLSNTLTWYHRNEVSIHPVTLQLQELDPAKCAPDPLRNRTFGGAVMAAGWLASDPQTLKSATPATTSHVAICVLTDQSPEAATWLETLAALTTQAHSRSLEKSRAEHRHWWQQFWSRSWVHVSGGNAKDTADVTRGWHMNRFLTACTARGNAPAKFNGAIFNVDGIDADGSVSPGLNADARAWGPGFWFQNERHLYWPMLQAGDYDQFLPFFKMYCDALPLARARSQAYYQHDGALFPETMYLWGTYLNSGDCGYGWDRRNKQRGLTDNGYIRRYWQGGIEVSAMMLEFFHHTRDPEFATATLLPVAGQIVTFYDQHYKRDSNGKIRLEPAQMLETMWDVVNPMPEIAGLNCVIRGLLELPDNLTTKVQRAQWTRVLGELPPLPMAKAGDTPGLANAETVRGGTHNIENGHLYAVWPYQRLGVAVGEIKLAQDSYANRWHKGGPYQCWTNDTIFAAYCGLAKEATDHLAYRFVRSDGLRFPAFYTHGDWVPDLDNGGVCQNTIQAMLMQTHGRKIVLLPAWPKDWNAAFKLHAPANTTVEGRVENGRLLELRVTPESRRKDVEILPAQ